MIDKPIEVVMRQSDRDIVIPSDLVATVNENNNLQHAFLVLTKVRYAKIPVVDNDNHLKGLISLPMITEQMLQDTGITTRNLDRMKIKQVMQKDVPFVYDRENLEVILRHLVDENFVAYVDHDHQFLGIITRRELFKEINFMAHNFSKQYIALPAYHDDNLSSQEKKIADKNR